MPPKLRKFFDPPPPHSPGLVSRTELQTPPCLRLVCSCAANVRNCLAKCMSPMRTVLGFCIVRSEAGRDSAHIRLLLLLCPS